MFRYKVLNLFVISALLAVTVIACAPPKPAEGDKLSEVEQLYQQERYTDAMNVARFNLGKDPKDFASIVTVWKVQVMQGNRTVEYATQYFKGAQQKVGDYGSGLAPYLARGLKEDVNNAVRLFCLLCLGEIQDSTSSAALMSVFDASYTVGPKATEITKEYLSGEAAQLLGIRQYKQAYDTIVSFIGSTQDAYAKAKAIIGLGFMGDQRAVEVLQPLAADQTPVENGTIGTKATESLDMLEQQK